MEFPLSEEGRKQAALAGRALSREPFEALYASPLSRAFETASIIRDSSGFAGNIIPSAGLSERHGGILEGHTWAEQERRNPELAKKFLSIPEEERWAFVGAETDEEVISRFGAAISSIRAGHHDCARIVVVSHGGVMRAFLRELFGPGVLPGAQPRTSPKTRVFPSWTDVLPLPRPWTNSAFGAGLKSAPTLVWGMRRGVFRPRGFMPWSANRPYASRGFLRGGRSGPCRYDLPRTRPHRWERARKGRPGPRSGVRRDPRPSGVRESRNPSPRRTT
jgi:broad specificity phosphatase PhoE